MILGKYIEVALKKHCSAQMINRLVLKAQLTGGSTATAQCTNVKHLTLKRLVTPMVFTFIFH